jgi:hypothetical protein
MGERLTHFSFRLISDITVFKSAFKYATKKRKEIKKDKELLKQTRTGYD